MDEKNKDLPLVVAEILIEMQQMRRENREEIQLLRQEFKEEMRANTDRLADTMSKLIGTLTEHIIETRDTVKDTRDAVKSIDKRLANVEQKVTEFVDFDRRLRVLEDIVLKKAS